MIPNELVIFLAFYALTLTAYVIHHWWTARCAKKNEGYEDLEALDPFANVRKHAKRFTAISLIAGAITHPTVWQALEHYVVHFVIYSGKIIRFH